MDARHTNEANEPPRKAAARFPVDPMRSLPRRSPLFVRLGLTAMLASVIGVASCVTGAALGMGEFGAMLLGLVAGGFGGLLGGLGAFGSDDREMSRDIATVERRIRALSSIKRDSQFDTLLAIDPAHPLSGICRAAHDALRDAHRDRLEAAMLRRDIEDRVVKTASKQTVHLTRLSMTDELTGLANRRGFEQRLEKMIERALRERFELCLLAFDLDDFKRLNDTLGHEKGDAALVAAGDIIRGHIRERDLGARVGGDELFFAMAGISIAEAEKVASRIADLFRVHPEGVGLACPWPGMSIGIAALQQHRGRDAPTLRRMADAALYASKREGRGRITVFCPSRHAGDPGRDAA